MRKMNFLLALCFVIFALAPQANAAVFKEIPLIRSSTDTASGIPAIPYKVVINQQNAQMYGQCMAKVIMAIEKEKVLVIPFPKGAENVQIFLPKHEGKDQGEVLSWIIEKALPYKPQGSVEKRRITYESMHDSLAGALTTLRAQETAMLDSLKGKSSATAKKEAEKLNPHFALVGTRIAAAERELAFAKKRAEQFQDSLPMSQQYVVRIKSPLPVDAEAFVSYTYTLSNSFWKPVYVMNANTKDNTIDVQLLAEVTQNSDLDWFNVQLELTTAQGDERAPRSLYPWIVSKSMDGVWYSKGEMAPRAMMAGSVANDSVPRFSQGASGNSIASWSIDKFPKLVEGKTMIKLSQEKWSVPLLRIARPAVSANKVWLSAIHKINSSFYPVGDASFFLDGVTTGRGVFEPKGGEAQLFFGADPLVTVETKNKERKSAEKGLIDKDQTWTWTWDYSVENKRNTPVTVRIEEPQTQVEDEKMSVTYADIPKPEQGPEKTFIWNVDVKAEGASVVKRSITVKAPSDMQLDLGR